MNCSTIECRTAMMVIGSVVTEDGKQIRTHYWCPTCHKRLHIMSENPRYVPMTGAQVKMLERERQSESKRERINATKFAEWREQLAKTYETQPRP